MSRFLPIWHCGYPQISQWLNVIRWHCCHPQICQFFNENENKFVVFRKFSLLGSVQILMSLKDFVPPKFVQHSSVIGNVIKRSFIVDIAVIMQNLTVAHSFISISYHKRNCHSGWYAFCNHFHSNAVLLTWDFNWMPESFKKFQAAIVCHIKLSVTPCADTKLTISVLIMVSMSGYSHKGSHDKLDL